MKDFLTNLALLTLLCPGLVFIFVYKIASSGRAPEVSKDNIAGYVAISALYNVVAGTVHLIPTILLAKEIHLDQVDAIDRLKVIAFVIVAPIFLGIVYAIVDRRKVFYRIAKRLNVDPIYPAPTAWDTMIERIPEGAYVIATLKDGTRISGNVDAQATFSTRDDYYDVYLSETDPVVDQATGVIRATWIASGELSTLEIVTTRPPTAPAQRLFFRPVH